MSDAGGEYKFEAYVRMLWEKGIRIFQSTPHTPMQDDQAEWLMCTLTDKADTMRLDCYAPNSWWDFVFTYATHLYNYTPM